MASKIIIAVIISLLSQISGLGLSFSGGGTRSAWLTIKTLQWLQENNYMDNVTHVSAISGGSWGLTEFTTGHWNGLGKRTFGFEMLDIFKDTEAYKLLESMLIDLNDSFSWWNTRKMFNLWQFKSKMEELVKLHKNGIYIHENYAKLLRDTFGKEFPKIMKYEQIHVLASTPNDNWDEKDLSICEFVVNSDGRKTICPEYNTEVVASQLKYQSKSGDFHDADWANYLALIGSAFEADFFQLNIPISSFLRRIFKPVKVSLRNYAKQSSCGQNRLSNSNSLVDAGFIANNPIMPLIRRGVKKIIMFDFSAGVEINGGWNEVLRSFKYMNNKDKCYNLKNIQITHKCKNFKVCPVEFSDVSIIEGDNFKILRIPIQSITERLDLVKLWPTSKMSCELHWCEQMSSKFLFWLKENLVYINEFLTG